MTPGQLAIVSKTLEAALRVLESRGGGSRLLVKGSVAAAGVPDSDAILSAVFDSTGHRESWEAGDLDVDQSLELLHAVRLEGRRWLREQAIVALTAAGVLESKALFGEARAAVGAFFGKAKRYVRELFVAGVLAVAGPQPLDAAEMRALDAEVAEQEAYLRTFEKEVVRENKPLDGTFVSRAEQYGASVWGASQEILRVGAKAATTYTREKRLHRGKDEPCPVCVEEEAKGWRPIGTLRKIGDSPCRCQCHCAFIFGDESSAKSFEFDSKRAAPCRDERGRFASCNGAASGTAQPKPTRGEPAKPKPGPGGGKKPRKPGKPKTPKKPKEQAKPKKPAAEKPAEKPKPAAKPAKPEKPKPAEKPAMPPKAPKPKPEKPAPKPPEKPKPEPKPEPPKPPKEDSAKHAEVLKQRHEAVDRRLANASHEIAAADKEVARAKSKLSQAWSRGAKDAAQKELQAAVDQRDALHRELGRVGEWKELVKKNPGLIPPGHIKDRIAQDYESASKVKALAEIDSDLKKAQQHHDVLRAEYDQLLNESKASGYDPNFPKIDRLHDLMRNEMPAAVDALKKSRDAAREQSLAILAAKNPLTIKAEAGSNFPDNIKGEIQQGHGWLSKVTERGNSADFAVEVKAIPPNEAQRAYYSSDNHQVNLTPIYSPAKTFVHEVGHAFDHKLSEGKQNALKRSLEFLEHRVGDESLTPMSKFGAEYGSREFGRKDNFDKVFDEARAHYVGKDYKGRGTEVLSMGVEKLYDDPTGFAKADPEYATWVIGMLGGRLR